MVGLFKTGLRAEPHQVQSLKVAEEKPRPSREYTVFSLFERWDNRYLGMDHPITATAQ